MNQSEYLRLDFKYDFSRSMPKSSRYGTEPRLEIFVLLKVPTACCKSKELYLDYGS
jgi:hypothetical protein